MTGILIRPGNLILAGYSFVKSSFTGTPDVNGMPLALGVEVTNNCNLSCPECITGADLLKRSRGYMDIELFERVVSQLGPYLYNINLYFQGEPMLHPDFFSFIARSGNIPTVVSTNGHFLTKGNSDKIVRSGLKKLIISLDGADQKTYSIYRKGGNFNKVIEGIKNVAKAKRFFRSPMKLEIQVLVNKLNECQVPELKEFARGVQASLRLKSMQVVNSDEAGRWMPVDKKYKRYYLKHGSYILKSHLPDRCARLWFNPVITWDGIVLPCCFDKNGDHAMGDLKMDTFRDIWNGPRYRLFRKSLLTDRSMIEICNNCTSGLDGVKY